MEKMRKIAVPRHRGAARDVLLAVSPLLDHFAVARQNCYDAGKLLLVHFPLHRGVEPLKSPGRESERLWFIPGKIEGLLVRLLSPGLMLAGDKEQSGEEWCGQTRESCVFHLRWSRLICGAADGRIPG
ncbi:MAG TPA: hypothetical protein VIN93_01270 [Bryobacteraceae bacterium]|jgi:hypothetical protein